MPAAPRIHVQDTLIYEPSGHSDKMLPRIALSTYKNRGDMDQRLPSKRDIQPPSPSRVERWEWGNEDDALDIMRAVEQGRESGRPAVRMRKYDVRIVIVDGRGYELDRREDGGWGAGFPNIVERWGKKLADS